MTVSEAEFQQQVIDLAHAYGWHHLHVRRSIGKGRKWVTSTNVVGWPDLFMWHPYQRRTIAVELKSETGVVSPEQKAVLASLEAAGVWVDVWRPGDLDHANEVLSPRNIGNCRSFAEDDSNRTEHPRCLPGAALRREDAQQ